MCGLLMCIFFEEESDVQVKIVQFQRPPVENRGSQFLIVGFLFVSLHRAFLVVNFVVFLVIARHHGSFEGRH